MPAETPEQSARAAQRVGLGCLSFVLIALGVAAGWAVWDLVSGRGLRATGWVYIICFIMFAASFARLARRARKPPRPSS